MHKNILKTVSFMLPTLAVAGTMVSCSNSDSSSQPPMTNTSWQVSNIYTTPDYPSELPDSVAGAVAMTFGGNTFTGFSGCSKFTGLVSFTKDKDLAPLSEATHLEVRDVKFSPVDENQCVGAIKYYHDALVSQLEQGNFSIDHNAGDIMTFTLDDGKIIDSPGFRLVEQ